MDVEKAREKIVRLLRSYSYRPCTVDELYRKIEIPAKNRIKFFNTLNKMRQKGQILITESGRVLYKPSKELTATVRSITSRGGFATLEEEKTDVFIPRDMLCGALPGDKVELCIFKKTDRLPEAAVLKLVERVFTEFTGTFHRIGKQAFIEPDNKYRDKIRVSSKDVKKAGDNEKVYARVRQYESKGTELIAAVVESYGPADSARACCTAILARNHIKVEFPKAVEEEAVQTADRPFSGDGRLDLRDQIIFTIDAASSKDLDDAVSVAETSDGFTLGVHIADVSNYVHAASGLDKEAFERGTSIYYADRVVPMLPKGLSNGICSLNPQEDRLTFSVFMDLSRDGRLLSYRLCKSIIRSRVKGVYSEINSIFSGEATDSLMKKYAEVLPSLKIMRGLAKILHKARGTRGAFDFETSESALIIDSSGVISDIKKRERGESEKLIEEFMLCANEAVATFAQEHRLPFVFRVHAEPEATKLEGLATALKAAGIDARSIHPGLEPKDVAKILTKIEGTPKAKALNDLVLRSMSKARYSPVCGGHFGLALKNYCHFTSPIRRYPDLAIHRILTDSLNGVAMEEIEKRYAGFAADASDQSSTREVAAMQIEWSCEDAYKAEYMSAHIGEQFSGTITSVKAFGMYVTLDNTVEGLVRVENIPGGWYEYDEPTMSMYCQRNGRRYSMGDAVRIIVERANVPLGQIDFALL